MGWITVTIRIVCLFTLLWSVNGIGVNWGTQASHLLPPDTVVRMLRENGIQKVKLFDADYGILKALGKTGIEVMVGIPNDMLASVGGSMKAAEKWVAKNVSEHISSNNVNIRAFGWEIWFGCCKYVAVGNEPFLETYNGSYLHITLPALSNIQSALIKAGIGSQVKVTVPLNADVYASSNTYPSGGDFRTDIFDPMLKIVKFLNDSNSPFTVNIYPFISLYTDSNFPVEYAFFDGNATPLNDGGTLYYNMFDANLDTLAHALQKNGFGNLPIIVGEIGWPTDGDRNANIEYARRFNQGFMSHISGGKGTPMRPVPIDAYLFSLIDEDEKSIDPGNFERHWGIFYFDGQVKYPLNLGTTNSGALIPAKGVQYLERKWCVMKPSAPLDDPQVAQSVSYACGLADCTSLGYGTSCGNLDARGNISYAFNSYFQKNNQFEKACEFPNVSVITKTDPTPTVGNCKFPIMIQPYYESAGRRFGCGQMPLPLVSVLLLLLLTVVQH
ncbi:hypothetical protein ES319_D08G097600v1 [Gossypium barbadense]|uniref:glucan endo-1,3-beta-D-glucosidase n=1 Tax=Gossypium barbadense TaxID=3634 RepID=A0A5J5QBK9_GOSBA|nr:hypothetical protein ES319_D08G097600v1 [Gossypium barbadense]